MPKIVYVRKKFHRSSLEMIETANGIIEQYRAQGFDLTLRQLYYQLVSRDIIPNKDTEYKRLGEIISDARLAGLVDWTAIVDRTRNVRSNSHWDEPSDIIHSAAASFAIDKWDTQDHRIEVWVEKDALVGVIGRICERLDVPYFSCRGYTSQSEMWAASQRLLSYRRDEQTPVIVHLGDHDPSGKDMTRDIFDRLELFMGGIEVKRIALNYDQIEQYNPPPNPAKVTDSRFAAYQSEFGDESWELDALEPTVISDLIEDVVLELRDEDAWNEQMAIQERGRMLLNAATERWNDVVELLEA